MWFNELKNNNDVRNYDVHNDAYSYDEDYSESSSEFFISPANAGGAIAISYAQKSIMSAILQKLKNRFAATLYVDENYGDGYNDCSYAEVYSED